MTLPTNLPGLLRQAGLTVVEVDGWRHRGRPGSFAPVGVLNHHTGASARGWTRAKELSYARWMFLTGRSDLPAPLCQIALGRSGVVYIGAAGRANHAGTAKASGSVSGGDGNKLYIGIEWMLSGTEAIPATMMEAGIRLNAVLSEKVTGNSVNTISCHYNTSITGKWDIGDPNGVQFKNVKVLDIPKFRTATKSRRATIYRTKPSPTKPANKGGVKHSNAAHSYVRAGHISMQHSDTLEQWAHDAERVFSMGYDWITGTEAGAKRHYTILKAAAKKHGYQWARLRGNWIAVKRSIIKKGTFKRDGEIVASRNEFHGAGRDRAVVWVSFVHATPGVGRISVVASHYPPKGRPKAKVAANRVNVETTTKMGKAVSAKMAELGKGKALAFYGGDQNIVDRHSDTFFGGPVTSAWDELKKWPNTGRGNIDVIASFNNDARTKVLKARRYTDKQLFLHTDHFLIEATYRINHSK